MYPLTIKKIRVLSQTQKNEVYNMIYKYHTGKVYHVLFNNNEEKITFQLLSTYGFDFMIKYRAFLNLVHTNMYN